jgi:hypothetical protein
MPLIHQVHPFPGGTEVLVIVVESGIHPVVLFAEKEGIGSGLTTMFCVSELPQFPAEL